MNFVGVMTFAGILHLLSSDMRIGNKARPTLRGCGRLLDCVDHERMGGHALRLCGRNCALLEIVGKLQRCGGHDRLAKAFGATMVTPAIGYGKPNWGFPLSQIGWIT